MAAQISAEEESVLDILLRILQRKGVKCEEQALHRLLIWCKRNGVRVHAFFVEIWEEAGHTLWEADTRGDEVAPGSLTT